jgi:hypothetical protein
VRRGVRDFKFYNGKFSTEILRHTVGAKPEAVARLRWTRRMATFQDVNARLNELVPNGGDARAMDQTAVFASLADAQLCLRRTDPEVVRAAQRTLEDVLLGGGGTRGSTQRVRCPIDTLLRRCVKETRCATPVAPA